MNKKKPKTRTSFNNPLYKTEINRGTYLEVGRNIDPSMKTDPDRRMYQHVESSPVLELQNKLLVS